MSTAAVASSPGVAARMSRQRRQGTGPELQLRRRLYAAGLRYRVGLKVPGLPRRTIDIAFPKVKIAVFVDGCFWHGCPRHVTWPVANADWWVRKIEANRRRDAATTAHLESLGWTVLRVWEHGVDESAAAVIGETVRSATASPCSRRDSSVPARLTPRDLGAG